MPTFGTRRGEYKFSRAGIVENLPWNEIYVRRDYIAAACEGSAPTVMFVCVRRPGWIQLMFFFGEHTCGVRPVRYQEDL